jgi:hypothetical protein
VMGLPPLQLNDHETHTETKGTMTNKTDSDDDVRWFGLVSTKSVDTSISGPVQLGVDHETLPSRIRITPIKSIQVLGRIVRLEPNE